MSKPTKNSKVLLLPAVAGAIGVGYIVINLPPASAGLEALLVAGVLGTLYFMLSAFAAKRTAVAISLGVIFLLVMNRLGSLDLLTFLLSVLIVIGIFLV